MTPIYNQTGRKYTTYEDKKQALLRQGFTLAEAIRMANSPDIPQIYGPTRKSKIIETYNY